MPHTPQQGNFMKKLHLWILLNLILSVLGFAQDDDKGKEELSQPIEISPCEVFLRTLSGMARIPNGMKLLQNSPVLEAAIIYAPTYRSSKNIPPLKEEIGNSVVEDLALLNPLVAKADNNLIITLAVEDPNHTLIGAISRYCLAPSNLQAKIILPNTDLANIASYLGIKSTITPIEQQNFSNNIQIRLFFLEDMKGVKCKGILSEAFVPRIVSFLDLNKSLIRQVENLLEIKKLERKNVFFFPNIKKDKKNYAPISLERCYADSIKTSIDFESLMIEQEDGRKSIDIVYLDFKEDTYFEKVVWVKVEETTNDSCNVQLRPIVTCFPIRKENSAWTKSFQYQLPINTLEGQITMELREFFARPVLITSIYSEDENGMTKYLGKRHDQGQLIAELYDFSEEERERLLTVIIVRVKEVIRL